MIRRIPFLLSLLLAGGGIAPVTVRADANPKCLETVVIQEGGRRKPFLVFAEETLRSLSGKTAISLDDRKASALAIVGGIWLDPDAGWEGKNLILVSNRPLRMKAGLDPVRKLFSPRELLANPVLTAEISAAAEMKRRDPKARLAGLTKEASDVGMRIGLLGELLQGSAYRLLPRADSPWTVLPSGPEGKEARRYEADYEALKGAWGRGDQAAFDAAANDLRQVQALSGATPPPWKIGLEVLYQKSHPFRWAWILYAAAGVILLISRGSWDRTGYRAASVLAGCGFLLQAAGLASRVLIAGRPPVTNMYESVIWVAFGTILFALLFELRYRAATFLLGAVPVAVASLILADSQPVILDTSIHPLTPVLRDNFWLSTHVLTITLSYAAFALALGVGHVALLTVLRGRNPSADLYAYLYKTLQVGVLLLAVGTILGGVWANYSWGRFWDWDPKETWALTALLGYLFLLHGRISGLWGGFGLAVGSVLAFQSVLMAWYGVNFVLGAGLHSYGFGTGGFPAVAAYVTCELLFVAAAVIARKKLPAAAIRG